MAQLLGTDYHHFQSAYGIYGLAKMSPEQNRVDLLAVVAHQSGSGSFRRFISALKENYQTICLWHVFNPFLPAVLSRYGFTPETEITGDGVALSGFRWDKSAPFTEPSCK